MESCFVIFVFSLFSFLFFKIFSKLRDTQQFEGSVTPSVPKLTGITKGFRKGELVLFTGPTGIFSIDDGVLLF